MIGDFERCYRAVQSRDPRFDGWFFTAVTSTGIYCRPSCPARTPLPHHVRFYPTAAAAQQAGFRACLRCRPDAVPGSPEWNMRADACARAMRLIADGVVDREGVAGLALRLGYGVRHIHRLLVAEVGAGPLALARAQRAQTARVLIESTDLSMADVAFAAGFSSVRQFNDTVRQALGRTPTELRRRTRASGSLPAGREGTRGRAGASAGHPSAANAISLRLPFRRPMAAGELFRFLGARAIPGIESYTGDTYTRSLRLPHGRGVAALSAADGHVAARLALEDLRDLSAAVGRCRRLLDLDADPEAIDEVLSEDHRLRPLVLAVPGRRVAGTVDGFELAVRAVLGQQVSVASARAVAARLATACGAPLELSPELLAAAGDALRAPVTRVFPTASELLGLPPAAFAVPAARRKTLRALAEAEDRGTITIDPGVHPVTLSARLLDIPGIGPWTAAYVAMRALGDPDAFLPTDLGVRRGLGRLGYDGSPTGALSLSERWRPWRAYAMAHLWAADHAAGTSLASRDETFAASTGASPTAPRTSTPKKEDAA